MDQPRRPRLDDLLREVLRTELDGLLRRINTYLVRWARRKFKRLRSFKKAKRWWHRLLRRQPPPVRPLGLDDRVLNGSDETGGMTGDLLGCARTGGASWSTSADRSGRRCARDHPRVRGEHARGLRRALDRGTIPAFAGSTDETLIPRPSPRPSPGARGVRDRVEHADHTRWILDCGRTIGRWRCWRPRPHPLVCLRITDAAASSPLAG